MSKQLIIDPEFKALIPPLIATEREQLEANILADGCLDSLKVWNGTLLDGHNRFEICTQHGITYRTEEISVSSREDAIIWICKNQMGRRNITDEQRTYLLGKQYEATKKVHGGTGANRFTGVQSAQNEPSVRTAYRVAAEMGVGKETVKRAEKYANGLDVIGESDPDLKQEILSGKRAVTKQDVSNIVLLPVQDRTKAIEKIKRGERISTHKSKFTVDELFPETTAERTVDDVVREIINASKEFLSTIDAIIDSNRDLIDMDQQKIVDAISSITHEITERTEMFK